MGISERDAPPTVRWNALDPNDEHTALIVPAKDLHALEAWADDAAQRLRGAVSPAPQTDADDVGAWEDAMADEVHRWTERCIAAEMERDELRDQLRGAVSPFDIVQWLRGRTGAHGGGFTSADDIADAIEREFTDAR